MIVVLPAFQLVSVPNVDGIVVVVVVVVVVVTLSYDSSHLVIPVFICSAAASSSHFHHTTFYVLCVLITELEEKDRAGRVMMWYRSLWGTPC